ncbi:hypothetical protein M2418_002662 [Rhizobium sp. BIGb0125]|uniref:hypothetical protein n=1 Tax=Rhizobium sp. BIGb0125 TaxID=2940618 RepID=UPI0021680D54|nr:hypothetical protein [Rhizobium sp. BIGb0125]MCS4243131.1 hypothetical protein [Rhizobium sp. BIGb0125]
MQTPHPYRYPAAFRAQLARLERLSPGITKHGAAANPSSRLIEIEHSGATIDIIGERNLRLRHLESLIADWHIDGERASQSTFGDSGDQARATIELSEIPACVTYIEFDPADELNLEFQPRSKVEGFYVREIVSYGRYCAEITFVCDEPAWRTMGTCVYADAMKVGSRISVGVIPLREKIDLVAAQQLFDGDTSLLNDPALLRAISAAGTTLAEYGTQKRSTRPPTPGRMG